MDEDEKAELAEQHSDKMCKLCEHHIIGGSSNTYHFQCEGRFCDQAVELLIDELEDDRLAEIQHQYDLFKMLLIRK